MSVAYLPTALVNPLYCVYFPLPSSLTVLLITIIIIQVLGDVKKITYETATSRAD